MLCIVSYKDSLKQLRVNCVSSKHYKATGESFMVSNGDKIVRLKRHPGCIAHYCLHIETGRIFALYDYDMKEINNVL